MYHIIKDSFLTAQECEELRTYAQSRVVPSLTVNTFTGQNQLTNYRTSYGTFLRGSSSPVICTLEDKLSEVSGVPIHYMEDIQIIRYTPGQEYQSHWDFFAPEWDGSPPHLRHAGQRIATAIIYLNTPDAGGETRFTDAGITVVSIRGRLLLFWNVHRDSGAIDLSSKHAGLRVWKGEKWVAVVWMRERKFR